MSPWHHSVIRGNHHIATENGEVEESEGGSASADFAMTSAAFSGLWQPNTLMAQQTKHSCPFGNCT